MANIRTAGRSGFIRRDGGRKRDTLWTGALWSENNIATGGALLLTTLGATLLPLRPFTVVRVRGMLQVNSDQVASTERQLGAYGMAVVSDQAVAIGITAVPTPMTDIDSDLWFLHQLFASFQTVFSAIGAVEYTGVPFDSKAMRKVEDGQDLISVVELDTNSDGATFSAVFRMLLKLH